MILRLFTNSFEVVLSADSEFDLGGHFVVLEAADRNLRQIGRAHV